MDTPEKRTRNLEEKELGIDATNWLKDKIKDTLTKVDEAKKKEDDEEGVASNTEFKLSLKHLLDKHVVKGGLKKVKK